MSQSVSTNAGRQEVFLHFGRYWPEVSAPQARTEQSQSRSPPRCDARGPSRTRILPHRKPAFSRPRVSTRGRDRAAVGESWSDKVPGAVIRAPDQPIKDAITESESPHLPASNIEHSIVSWFSFDDGNGFFGNPSSPTPRTQKRLLSRQASPQQRFLPARLVSDGMPPPTKSTVQASPATKFIGTGLLFRRSTPRVLPRRL